MATFFSKKSLGVVPGARRLVRIEARLLEHVLVVVENDGGALEWDAPRLAAGLAVLHERRVEALEPRLVLGRLDEIVEGYDRILVDQRIHVGRQQDRGDRRLAALDRGQGLRDRLLVAAGINRLDLDPRVLLLEIGGEAIDNLGDRPADRDRIEERDFDRRLGTGARGDERHQQRARERASGGLQNGHAVVSL